MCERKNYTWITTMQEAIKKSYFAKVVLKDKNLKTK